jgi:hypothetical protein
MRRWLPPSLQRPNLEFRVCHLTPELANFWTGGQDVLLKQAQQLQCFRKRESLEMAKVPIAMGLANTVCQIVPGLALKLEVMVLRAMPSLLIDICCASLPPAALRALAVIRDLPGITVALTQDRAWVRWEPGDDAVLRALLPLHGVHLYVRREDRWYRHGRHLPAFDFPAHADYRPLHQVLTPAPLRPMSSGSQKRAPLALKLARNHQPRPTTALCCGLPELARWADTVPHGRLETLQAARSGNRILLLGSRLPPLASGDHFWGQDVLVPLGSRPDPDWPAQAIRAALDIASHELLLLTAAGADVIPKAALQSLTRAQIRLALKESAP